MAKKFLSLFILVFSDILAIFISFWLAYHIRNALLPDIFPRFTDIQLLPFSTFLNNFYLAIVWICIFAYERLYTKRFPLWDEIKVLMQSSSISFALIMIMIFITRQQLQYSRTIVVLAWLMSLFFFPLFRYFSKYSLTKFNIWKKKLIG